MPGDPIIIDDGGSTRIKQLHRDLDGLLDNTDVTKNPFGAATQLTILAVDSNGTSALGILTNPPAPPTPTPTPFVPGDSIVITSDDQKTTVSFDALNNKLQIDLTPAVAGGPQPSVAAKKHSGQRRYIVENAGSISKIQHVRPGAGGFTKTFKPAASGFYTMLHIDD